ADVLQNEARSLPDVRFAIDLHGHEGPPVLVTDLGDVAGGNAAHLHVVSLDQSARARKLRDHHRALLSELELLEPEHSRDQDEDREDEEHSHLDHAQTFRGHTSSLALYRFP